MTLLSIILQDDTNVILMNVMYRYYIHITITTISLVYARNNNNRILRIILNLRTYPFIHSFIRVVVH
jgi:hypothetical protein